MLKNVYLLAKIGADTAENERKFSEIFRIFRNVPNSPPVDEDYAFRTTEANINGTYRRDGTNHSKPVFKKVSMGLAWG